MGDRAEIDRLKVQLGLIPHPAGFGAFREQWKADRHVAFVTKTSHTGSRTSGTSIYMLLYSPLFIKWHKHLSDEAFFWHAGGRVKIHLLRDDGSHECHMLGDVVKYPECTAQCVVPHDTWYSAELLPDTNYCLYSAVVMPGFEYEDSIDGKRDELLRDFPQHKDLICRLA